MIVYKSIHDAPPLAAGSCAALGLFDGLHRGHQAVIRAAADRARQENCAAAVFTFTMDRDHPAAKPATERLLSASCRDGILEEMGVTHLLCPPFEEFRDMEPDIYVEKLLREILRARVVFTGENYHFGKKAAGNVADLHRLCGERGILGSTLPMVVVDGEPASSTRIRRSIAQGDMVLAERMLGRPFALDMEGILSRGAGGEPVFRQEIPSWHIKPRTGTYTSIFCADGEKRTATSVIRRRAEGLFTCSTTPAPKAWEKDPVIQLVERLGD